MKRIIAGVLTAAFLALGTQAQAAEAEAPPKYDWSFDGIFGKFDRAALQRGYQVYREVCAACHSMRLVAFRDLTDLGYDVDQIKAFAAESTVVDGPDDEGEMFERDGRPADRMPSPFPNAKAAAAANGGAAPPDLSLMAKARKEGPSYIRALVSVGYEEPPADVEILEGQNYNIYFPGNRIAMAPPLDDDAVEYQDGTEASVDQMAADVAQFLMWTAEPKMEQRKETGIKVILFLLVFTGILYAIKRKVWADLH
jgi:ubiquinol-cytochrome c reductase cytochrome c1 subunit